MDEIWNLKKKVSQSSSHPNTLYHVPFPNFFFCVFLFVFAFLHFLCCDILLFRTNALRFFAREWSLSIGFVENLGQVLSLTSPIFYSRCFHSIPGSTSTLASTSSAMTSRSSLAPPGSTSMMTSSSPGSAASAVSRLSFGGGGGSGGGSSGSGGGGGETHPHPSSDAEDA